MAFDRDFFQGVLSWVFLFLFRFFRSPCCEPGRRSGTILSICLSISLLPCTERAPMPGLPCRFHSTLGSKHVGPLHPYLVLRQSPFSMQFT